MSILIKELLEKAIFEATAHQDDAYFITIQNSAEKQNWLQITGDSINTYYPFPENPEVKIPELGLPVYDGFKVSLWEAELFLTVSHAAKDLDAIVAFIEAYLVTVLGYDAANPAWEVSYE
jgi:hypothetical protein